MVDYKKQLFEELEEEVGIPYSCVERAVPFAMIYDKVDPVVDICLALHLKTDTPLRKVKGSEEYPHFQWVPREELHSFIDFHNKNIVPTTIAILSSLQANSVI
jgi:hypothetical protein